MDSIVKTARGVYRVKLAAPPEHRADATVLTLALERSDGIERVAFRCAIGDDLSPGGDPAAIIARMVPWIEREFEMTRETALKVLRSERRVHEIRFDAAHRGPF